MPRRYKACRFAPLSATSGSTRGFVVPHGWIAVKRTGDGSIVEFRSVAGARAFEVWADIGSVAAAA